jgi:hypothetical protein
MAAPALGDDVLEVTLTQRDPEASESAERRTIVITGRGQWTGRSDQVAQALAAETVDFA